MENTKTFEWFKQYSFSLKKEEARACFEEAYKRYYNIAKYGLMMTNAFVHDEAYDFVDRKLDERGIDIDDLPYTTYVDAVNTVYIWFKQWRDEKYLCGGAK